ncbi:MAG: mechanosensitive ion channel [Bacteroidales bacterium]|nr:mechanosensitive ion channel [Bacteroidales bacterium]
MKDTHKIAETLLAWIKKVLIDLGFSQDVVGQLDQFIYIILILLIAVLMGRLIRFVILFFSNKLLKAKNLRTLNILVEQKAFHRISRLIPPIIVIALLPFALQDTPKLLSLIEKFCWIYIVVVFIMSSNSFLSALLVVFSRNSELRDRPMKGLVQIIQVLLVSLAVIVIVAILLNKSPANLITGLGAFAAVLMLVFRDSILGFVAGVLLSQNDMIRHGDWIVVPGSDVDGVVIDITLNTVKVQNFDNTIVTVPPYSLVSQPFQNWRGMSESGGRRIMRSYTIDLNTVQFCTPEMLEDFKQIDLLHDYITEKQAQQQEGKEVNTENPAGLVNGTIETNLGLFRAYMTLYLRQHPSVNQDLTLMVRTLAPSDNGLPLQVYCFSANKVWISYESIQAEIMEHFAAIMPRFGLYPFQNPSGRDYITSALLESGKDITTLMGAPVGVVRKQKSTNAGQPELPGQNKDGKTA